MKDGVIADFEIAEGMIKELIKESLLHEASSAEDFNRGSFWDHRR